MVKITGKLKIWQSRLGGYLSLVNFAMLFYLYIVESPMGLDWYHWLIIIVLVMFTVLFIDISVVYPNALNYSFKKHPGFQALKKQTGENSKKLDKIIKYLEKKDG